MRITLWSFVTTILIHRAAASVVVETLIPSDECEAVAEEGDHLMLQYNVTDMSGSKNFDHAAHMQTHVLVGADELSPAWTEGLTGMCKGELRRITFPRESMVGFGPTLGEVVQSDETTYKAEIKIVSLTKSADYTIFKHLQAGESTVVLDMIDNHTGVNAVDEYGATPLMVAVQLKMQVIVAVLLNAWKPKVDVNFAKPSGHTVLFYAVAQQDYSILRALLKRGADPNVALVQPDSLGWTPLHFACKFENIKHVQALLDYGADPLVETLDGKTVLDVASASPYSVRKKIADILNEAVMRMEEAEESEDGGSAREDL